MSLLSGFGNKDIIGLKISSYKELFEDQHMHVCVFFSSYIYFLNQWGSVSPEDPGTGCRQSVAFVLFPLGKRAYIKTASWW